MEVNPPPLSPWRAVMEEIMVLSVFRGIWYIRSLSPILFFVYSMTTSWRTMLLAFIGVKNITSCTKHVHGNCSWGTAIIRLTVYQLTHCRACMSSIIMHKGVISQVYLYTNVTLYDIKITLWYIIFHRDQYFTFWWNMNASMSLIANWLEAKTIIFMYFLARYRNFLPQVDQKVHQVLQNLPQAFCIGDVIRYDNIKRGKN